MQFGVQAIGVQERVMHFNPCALSLLSARNRCVAGCSPQVGNGTIGLARELSCSRALSSQFLSPSLEALRFPARSRHFRSGISESIRAEPIVAGYANGGFADENDGKKIAEVAKRLERTAGRFKRLGSLGFWGQLVCTVVAAVILAFSVVVTGQVTSPVSIYLTAGGIAAAFVSVFWSFGYIRLAKKLREIVGSPNEAPPRAQVVKNIKNGIIINLLGMGATLLGLQATVGVLVAKALTSSGATYMQGAQTGYSPVLALDVFLVQASGNAILAHFLGLISSLELLRSLTNSPSNSETLKTA